MEISLDELVSGEKYVRNIEKEPVITVPKSLMVQTVLYAVACIPYLVMCLYGMGVLVPYEIYFYEGIDLSITVCYIAIIAGTWINFVVMLIGLYYSMRNELSSRCIGWIMSIRFFVDIIRMLIFYSIMIPMILVSGNGTIAWSSRLRFLFVFIAPFILLRFFNAKRPLNVRYVYAVACISTVFLLYDIGSFAYFVNYNITRAGDGAAGNINDVNYLVNLIDFIGDLAYILLLAFQAYTLNKKRAAADT